MSLDTLIVLPSILAWNTIYPSIYFEWSTIFYILFGIVLCMYLTKIRRPLLIHSNFSKFALDGTLNTVIALRQTIIPPLWCWSSSFQIIFFLLRNALCDRAARFQSEDIGNDLQLSWAEQEPLEDEPPILLFLHGLMCSSDDLPGTSFIHAAIKRGWKVVVHNRPGHLANLTKPRFSIFGDYEDVDIVVKHIRAKFPNRHLACIGFSAGCFPLLRYLGETGPDSQIDAAVCISGGIKLSDAFDNCSFLFQQIFIYKAKEYFLQANETILRKHNNDAYEQAIASYRSRSFVQSCAAFVTDSGKWRDAEKKLDPFPVIKNIETPVLFLNAEDDPITGSLLPYQDTVFRTNPNLLLAVSSTGSHCPFLHGFLSPEDYSKATSLEFVAHQVQLKRRRESAVATANEVKLRNLFETFSPPKEKRFSPRTSVLRKRDINIHLKNPLLPTTN